LLREEKREEFTTEFTEEHRGNGELGDRTQRLRSFGAKTLFRMTTGLAVCLECSAMILRREEIPEKEPDVSRAFRETANKPGIPVGAIRDENNRTAALLHEAFLLGTLNTIEHLHFELAIRHSLPCHKITDAPDEADVVGSKCGAGAIPC